MSAGRDPVDVLEPLLHTHPHRALGIDRDGEAACRHPACVAEQVHAMALAANDRILGLQLADIPADGCITKAP